MVCTGAFFEAEGLCPSSPNTYVPRRDKDNGPDPIALAFGTALRVARKQRGLTLEDVAGNIPRLDARYLGEIELGWHAPTIVTAKRLADALGVPLADLVASL